MNGFALPSKTRRWALCAIACVWVGTSTAQAPRVNFPSGGFADVEQVISGWYQRYLGRPAEPAGLQGWVNAIRRGKTLRDVQVDLLSSDEFYARSGQRDDLFLRALYKSELGRIPTAEETNHWLRRLRKNGDRRSKTVREFLEWAEGQAQVAPPVVTQPVDLTRQLVDEAVLLRDSGRRELAGTVQGQQLSFRTLDLVDAADQLHRAQLRRDFRPEQMAQMVTNLDRSLSAVEEALGWPAGTAPVTVSIARRMRGEVDTLRQTLGVTVNLPPRPDVGIDLRGLDSELGALADDVENSVRILRFPLRPTYVDAIVLREMTGLASQIADFRNQLWTGNQLSQMQSAVAALQRRSAGIAHNLSGTSQVVPLTPQWQQVENRLAGIAQRLGQNTWPGSGPISAYPPATGPAPLPPGTNLVYVIDAITADIEVFLESLTPIITTYPDAFWMQAEYRRLRANLLLLRELASRGANPAQIRDQLARVMEGYQRIQQRMGASNLRTASIAPPRLDDRLGQLQRAIATP